MVNQFTVVEAQHNRRPDVIVFVNGLPLALIELKSATVEGDDIWAASDKCAAAACGYEVRGSRVGI